MTGLAANNQELEKRLYSLFRDFVTKAEKKRRWFLEDIPWDRTNPRMPPAIVSIVESFTVVELYVPDYVALALPMIRENRAWSAIHLNWGYEETKHSIALEDWLVRAGHRTEEQLLELKGRVFEKTWTRRTTAVRPCLSTRWCRSWRRFCTTATCASMCDARAIRRWRRRST